MYNMTWFWKNQNTEYKLNDYKNINKIEPKFNDFIKQLQINYAGASKFSIKQYKNNIYIKYRPDYTLFLILLQIIIIEAQQYSIHEKIMKEYNLLNIENIINNTSKPKKYLLLKNFKKLKLITCIFNKLNISIIDETNQTQECDICFNEKEITLDLYCCKNKIICKDCYLQLIQLNSKCPFCRKCIQQ